MPGPDDASAGMRNDSETNMTSSLGSSSRWASTEGLSFPLGATWIEEERAFNFALYSKHAQSVTLLVYTENDIVNPVFVYPFSYLKNKSGRIWHCRIPLIAMEGAAYYACRVDGPEPAGRFEWHAFDRDKTLLDPYAKSVFFPPTLDRLAAARPGSNAGKAPLGVLTGDREGFDWGRDRGPRHEATAVIYELHVGGFTKNPNSGVETDARGTYAGLIEKIPYLQELGITVVELMPVLQYDPSDGNYWGYAPLNFLAPHNGYLSRHSTEAQHNEFRKLVKALHAADIEVVLDVVYNHTGEGDHTGPTYSYRGIDNSTYYLIANRPGAPYENFSGTGNTLNCANRAVRKMVMDSVRPHGLDRDDEGRDQPQRLLLQQPPHDAPLYDRGVHNVRRNDRSGEIFHQVFRPNYCQSCRARKFCYSRSMKARAALSLLLAFALAFAPLAMRAATLAAGMSTHGVHDSSVASTMEDHRTHAAHEGNQVESDMPASGCMDHAQCKGSCAAHCVSLPASTVRAALGAEPIQASRIPAFGPTFAPDTPSRPPKTFL